MKKVFQRIFVSEFTDKHKFMHVGVAHSDANALLRQIAVTFPTKITWRENRSFMLGQVSHVRKDEVHIKGYIKQNFLNAKRLIHVTGLPVVCWKIKRIEAPNDPCPAKLS